VNRCACRENLPPAPTEPAVFAKRREAVKDFMHAESGPIHHATIPVEKDGVFD
jgi:hypothetical protein